MFSNIKIKLLNKLLENMQYSLERFKSMYYKKGFEYLEKSERIVFILEKIDNYQNHDDRQNFILIQNISKIQEEINIFLNENKEELRKDYFHFQINSKLAKYIEGGQIFD